jgi:hypothetical protein
MIQGELFSGNEASASCSAEAFGKVDVVRLRQLTETEFLALKDGATADEVAYRLCLVGVKVDEFSIRPRVSELKDAKILVPTGERRKNRKGNSCAVLRHKNFGEAK